jgi:hypothetical protein
VAAAHRQVEARLVEEDETIDRHPTDLPQEGVSFDDDVRPETLQRPSAFFLTT